MSSDSVAVIPYVFLEVGLIWSPIFVNAHFVSFIDGYAVTF